MSQYGGVYLIFDDTEELVPATLPPVFIEGKGDVTYRFRYRNDSDEYVRVLITAREVGNVYSYASHGGYDFIVPPNTVSNTVIEVSLGTKYDGVGYGSWFSGGGAYEVTFTRSFSISLLFPKCGARYFSIRNVVAYDTRQGGAAFHASQIPPQEITLDVGETYTGTLRVWQPNEDTWGQYISVFPHDEDEYTLTYPSGNRYWIPPNTAAHPVVEIPYTITLHKPLKNYPIVTSFSFSVGLFAEWMTGRCLYNVYSTTEQPTTVIAHTGNWILPKTFNEIRESESDYNITVSVEPFTDYSIVSNIPWSLIQYIGWTGRITLGAEASSVSLGFPQGITTERRGLDYDSISRGWTMPFNRKVTLGGPIRSEVFGLWVKNNSSGEWSLLSNDLPNSTVRGNTISIPRSSWTNDDFSDQEVIEYQILPLARGFPGGSIAYLTYLPRPESGSVIKDTFVFASVSTTLNSPYKMANTPLTIRRPIFKDLTELVEIDSYVDDEIPVNIKAENTGAAHGTPILFGYLSPEATSGEYEDYIDIAMFKEFGRTPDHVPPGHVADMNMIFDPRPILGDEVEEDYMRYWLKSTLAYLCTDEPLAKPFTSARVYRNDVLIEETDEALLTVDKEFGGYTVREDWFWNDGPLFNIEVLSEPQGWVIGEVT